MKVGSPRAENVIQFLVEAHGKFGMESYACERQGKGKKEQI